MKQAGKRKFKLSEVVSKDGENFVVARAFLNPVELIILRNICERRRLENCYSSLNVDALYDGTVYKYVYARKTTIFSRENLERLIVENLRPQKNHGRPRSKALQMSIDSKLRAALAKLENY